MIRSYLGYGIFVVLVLLVYWVQFILPAPTASPQTVTEPQFAFLSHSLQTRIELIKAQATTISYETGSPLMELPMGFLAWIKAKAVGKHVVEITEKKFQKNLLPADGKENDPQWNAYILSLFTPVEVQALTRNPIKFISPKNSEMLMKQLKSDWLGLVFLMSDDHRGVSTETKSVLLTLVSTDFLFSGFKSNPETRFYMVDEHGEVLYHSGAGWQGTSISKQQVLMRKLTDFFQSSEPSQSMTFRSMDQLEVDGDFMRIGNFPYAMISERILQKIPTRIKSQILQARLLSIFGIGCLIYFFWFQFNSKKNRLKSPPQESPEILTLAEDSQLFTLEECGMTDPPPLQSLNSEEPPWANAQILETKFIKELENSPEQMQQELQSGILKSKYEMELLSLEDRTKIAHTFCTLLSNLTLQPLLFFSHANELRSGVLIASGGFRNDEQPGSLSFPIFSNLLNYTKKSVNFGGMITLSHYPPLIQMITKKFQLTGFSAFAVMALHQPALLGVVVFLERNKDIQNFRYESLDEIFKITGMIYEKAYTAKDGQDPPGCQPPTSVARGLPIQTHRPIEC